MYGKSLVALAAIGAVNASPVLNVRQASSVASSAASAASSAVSSVASDVSSSAVSATSAASSAVSSAASSAAPSSMMSSMMSSAASSAASSTGAVGDERYTAYPCPAGTLLTYAQVNQTFDVPISQLTNAAGEFATSPIFPNITQSEGGNSIGATHSFDLMGLNVSEVLVNVTTNSTSGYAQWVWNNTAPITISGIAGIEGLELANYSTVLQLYNPDFSTTGTEGNSSLAVLFTNACFSNQDQGAAILSTLGNLELGNLATAVGSNSSMTGGETSMMSSMMPSSTMDSMMSSSTMMSAASSAASGAESATSAAASGASSAASGASSVAGAATSAVAGAASSAAAAVTSSA